jgi:DNA-binding NarL/FixJ family response regulator
MRTEDAKGMRANAQRDFPGTVLIADDHEVFRLGLAQLLRSSLKVKRFLEAETFSEVASHLKDPELVLVVIDLGLDGMENVKDLARIRRQRPDVQLVVVSGRDSRDDILQALWAGVHGYIVKSQHIGPLIDKLRYILSGEIYVPPILAEQPAPEAPQQQRLSKKLSSRQHQVLKGLVEGKSNKEIAKGLNVAEGTVKMHLAALYRVLGATNRAHAAALGKQLIG